MNKVTESFNNEWARVGIYVVDGMESLVTLIANGQESGGRSKD